MSHSHFVRTAWRKLVIGATPCVCGSGAAPLLQWHNPTNQSHHPDRIGACSVILIAFQHHCNLPLASSLSQSLPPPPPPPPPTPPPPPNPPPFGSNQLSLPPINLCPRPSGPLPWSPCRPPLPFQLHSSCLHWSRLSLSPAEFLPSVIHPADQCRLNIRYPLRSLHSPCPTLTPLPPLPIT